MTNLKVTKTTLRTIREERTRFFVTGKRVKDPICSEENNQQRLFLDLPFKTDIVSFQDLRRKKYKEDQEKKYTPFSEVSCRWVKEAKNLNHERNRRSIIKTLTEKKVLITDGHKIKSVEFLQCNRFQDIKKALNGVKNISENTINTYLSEINSLIKYIAHFIYGAPRQKKTRIKYLKRGRKPLELFEAATIFDELEKMALKSNRIIPLRDLLIIRIIFLAGENARIIDVLMLSRIALNPKKLTITISGIEVNCSSSFMNLLKSYLGPRRSSLFEIEDVGEAQTLINKRLDVAVQKANVNRNVTLQELQRSLRHILGSNAILNSP